MDQKRLRYMGCAACLLLALLNASGPMRALRSLPSDIYLAEGEAFSQALQAPFSIQERSAPVGVDYAERLGTQRADTLRVTLFGVVPVKAVTLHTRPARSIVPGGQSIGVTLHTRGALVVGLGSFTAENGTLVSPAQAAGLRAGDVLLAVNGVTIENANHLISLCDRGGAAVSLTVQRGESTSLFTAQPVRAEEDSLYKLGMWVRDSTAGIGTLSFYRADDLAFGALGHPITDVDVGSVLQIGAGEITNARVMGVSSGEQGAPGELHGMFQSVEPLGRLETNTACGVFGRLYKAPAHPLYPAGVPLAYPEEIATGPAQILATVDETGVRAFACEILKCYPQQGAQGKNLVLRITDEALLAITGGIVQGMSGSPILQNGKLIGAVTHVFVNDPARGYGVFAQTMLEACAEAGAAG